MAAEMATPAPPTLAVPVPAVGAGSSSVSSDSDSSRVPTPTLPPLADDAGLVDYQNPPLTVPVPVVPTGNEEGATATPTTTGDEDVGGSGGEGDTGDRTRMGTAEMALMLEADTRGVDSDAEEDGGEGAQAGSGKGEGEDEGDDSSSDEEAPNTGSYENAAVPAPGSEEDLGCIFHLEWYHPTCTRHIANTLLLENGEEGSYLLRPSETGGRGRLSLSVRGSDSVKHFSVSYENEALTFGLRTFASPEAFVNHFANCPLLGGESGVLILLRHPYPRTVMEPNSYHEIVIHRQEQSKQAMAMAASQGPVLSMTSKEGFLTKKGYHVTNWKKRWFVLDRMCLQYFKHRGDKVAKGTVDLTLVEEVASDDTQNREFCFCLKTPKRVFFFKASTSAERQEWIDILQWKLDQNRQHAKEASSAASAAKDPTPEAAADSPTTQTDEADPAKTEDDPAAAPEPATPETAEPETAEPAAAEASSDTPVTGTQATEAPEAPETPAANGSGEEARPAEPAEPVQPADADPTGSDPATES